MNLPYIVPRVVRHFLPDHVARSFLRVETRDAAAAVRPYLDVLAEQGGSFRDKRVLVFGFGGRFDIARGLLQDGAAHVLLVDPYAEPIELRMQSDRVTVIRADVRRSAVRVLIEPVDVVISTSAFEHVQDVEGTAAALEAVTRPDGMQIHFIDLRDHYFRYPFEMLCFTESTWRRWLDPASHHNRFRLRDFRQAFEDRFGEVDIHILSRNDAAFRKALPRIRPEFLSGQPEEDAAEIVRVVLRRPGSSVSY